MAPDRLSHMRWRRSVAVRGGCNVSPQRFSAAWVGGRCLRHCHLTNSQAQLANFFVGTLTFYLVATAWWAARRRDGETGIFDWAALLVAFSVGAALVISGLEAAYGNAGLKNDFPAAPYFVFGSVALLSAAGDVRMLVRGGVSGAKRIVRHLWRMSFAFLIAAFSFFLGQQKVMPAYIRGSKLLFVPPLLILIVLIYWLCRMWLTNVFKHRLIAAKPTTAPL
jgi:hypothetical protein